jgi:hypothetical protein
MVIKYFSADPRKKAPVLGDFIALQNLFPNRGCQRSKNAYNSRSAEAVTGRN